MAHLFNKILFDLDHAGLISPKALMKITLIHFLLSFLCISGNAQVGINEIMSNNQTTIADGMVTIPIG